MGRGWLRAALYGALALAGLYLLLRFALGWLAPFLFSFALAAVLERPVSALSRWGLGRRAAALLLSLCSLGLLGWLLCALAGRGFALLGRAAAQAPELMSALVQALRRLEQRLLGTLQSLPPELKQLLPSALAGAEDLLYALPGRLSRMTLDLLGKVAQQGPDVLLFAVTAGLGTYFCSASFPSLCAFLRCQIPKSLRRRLTELGGDLRCRLGGLLRAQLMLMGLSFLSLLLGFALMGLEDALGLAALISLIDALPVFGTGTVLLPWALGALLLGQRRRALGLSLTWAASWLLRSGAQAKLVGDQIGLDPLSSLLSVYVGWKIAGVPGMLLCPLAAVTLRQLNDRGVVHLWNSF